MHDDDFVFSCAQQLEDSDIKHTKDDEHQPEGSDISQRTSSVTPEVGIGRCIITNVTCSTQSEQ